VGRYNRSKIFDEAEEAGWPIRNMEIPLVGLPIELCPGKL
jgi:hypothetical protein